jgi:hypothetical protein
LGENGIALEEFPIKIKAEVAEGMGSGIVAAKKIEVNRFQVLHTRLIFLISPSFNSLEMDLT